MQMTIIEACNSLKCKLLFGFFRDGDLQWYVGILRASIANYQELVKEPVHQFIVSRNRKMSTTNLFNIQ